jgi:type I restriction enzyme, R subunit
VNRVFRDKPAGLVVDYIGVAQNLKSALGQYAGHGGDQVGINEAEAIRVLLEKYEIVRAMFRPNTKAGSIIVPLWMPLPHLRRAFPSWRERSTGY